jgi:hypothetical protein
MTISHNTKELGQIAIDFGKSAHALETSLIKVSFELTDRPMLVAQIVDLLASLGKLRKSIADLAYDKELHCESCYEQADYINEKLDNCELCFECLVGTNDNKHLFECWGVHQAE